MARSAGGTCKGWTSLQQQQAQQQRQALLEQLSANRRGWNPTTLRALWTAFGSWQVGITVALDALAQATASHAGQSTHSQHAPALPPTKRCQTAANGTLLCCLPKCHVADDRVATKTCDGRMAVYSWPSGKLISSWKVPGSGGSSSTPSYSKRCCFGHTKDGQYICIGE